MDTAHLFSRKQDFVDISAAKDRDALGKALSGMILSASGWRKIYGKDEESSDPSVTDEDRIITAGAAFVFHSYICKRYGKKEPCIALGLDSRPTGAQAGEAVARTLLSLGCRVRYLHICAAPEIMAYVKKSEEIDGFIYISASHNPKGYNGIKFGPGTGAVLGGKDSGEIISGFRKMMEKEESALMLAGLLNSTDPEALSETAASSGRWKKESYKAYLDFALEIYSPGKADGRTFMGGEKSGGPGIIGDLNGSARCTSIDPDFFKLLGMKYRFTNSTPGLIVHPILPEGENLRWCRKELETAHRDDSAFILGYMPDNDGDRGNLVYIDERTKKAEILKAQEVFALTCLAELSFMKESGMLDGRKGAVVVNDPTSSRIEKIARLYGVEVFRAEVGEANVVNLALNLERDGWFVRYLGEGSNGGSITFPATVRDPLNTIGAIVRLLRMRKGEALSGIIGTLPRFTTTETGDELAKMQIKTANHGTLKERYEKIFLSEWEEKKGYLKEQAGITSWEEINYMQTDAVKGTGSSARGSRVTGGLKILFRGPDGIEKGFIWMRGSGTEPIFRVMADIEGENNPLERFLIKWQREMIGRADNS